MSSPLILIDGSSYFFRAFHALPPLTNSKGQPTGAIYGVTNMIKKLMRDYNPSELAVVFDAKGKTFRNEWYPDYKAHRPPMPSDLSSQFQPLLEVLTALGLPLLIVEGVEADDVIGTLAKQATEKGISVLVSTGDKDMAQLVNDHITLINTMSNYTMNIEGVKQKFGVAPEQIIDYLALIGDSSDNIPGVTKCGPKTAIKWLEQHQTLEKIIENAHTVSGKIGEYLRASLEHLPLSKRLVTIRTDVELPFDIHQLKLNEVNQQKLRELYQEMEFKNWLKELDDTTPAEAVSQSELIAEEIDYEVVNSQEQLDSWIRDLKKCEYVCIDIETTHLEIIPAKMVGMALAIDNRAAAYIPFNHKEDSLQLPMDYVLNQLRPILENSAIKKIGQNIKYDYAILKTHGINLKGIAFDPMLESYVLNSTSSRHNMDSLALKYLGVKTITFEEIAGKGSKQLCFDEIPVEKAAAYAAEDAHITLKLHQQLYPMLADSLQKVLHDIEMPLTTILAEMELCGVLIDADTLQKHGNRLKERIKELETEAIVLAGKPFNLNSPKQLQEILYDLHQLPVLVKTPKGQPSTAESVLQQLAYDYRLAEVILEYRSLSKLVSTYIDALPKKIDSSSGRVHTSYNQAVTATGRLSSSDPNLQNIPIRNEEGRLIRTAFIAPPEQVILAADYSQIELRIMAHLSQDSGLLTAFAKGWDIHTATASEIFQVPHDQVSGEHRRRAKAINFGLIYGMSAFGLAKQIGVERQEAQKFIDLYFQRYPKVLEYMDNTRKQAHDTGYVETLYGRRLYLPEINTRQIMRRRAAERMAINAPMQGTAADIIKRAMISIANWQNSQTVSACRMIMQVHDELVFEVQESKLQETQQQIKDLMESAATLDVPLVVSIGSGMNWDAAH